MYNYKRTTLTKHTRTQWDVLTLKLSLLVKPTTSINKRTLKTKIISFSANSLFSQEYLRKVIIHNYVNINVPNTFPAVKYMKCKE
jgi:hypothetical protein